MKKSIFCVFLVILLQNVPLFAQKLNLITNQTTYWPAPVLAKPGYLQSVIDPTFGTKITRIVGDPGTAIPNVTGQVWAAQQERHAYSKQQVWNSDQSMIYLERHYPNVWLNGETYEVLFSRTKPSSYVLWSHTEPKYMYHTGRPGNCHLGKWDVVNNTSVELVDLRNYSGCSFGEGEGNFNSAGTKVAVYGKRITDGKNVIFVIDVVAKTKGPDYEVSDLDNCTMSPSGDYIIVGFGNDELKVLDASNGKVVWTDSRYGLPSHFDVQVDQSGAEVVVGIGKTSPYSGQLIKRKLSDGTITALVTKGYGSHTSGRNLNRPGWVYVTYANTQTNQSYLPYINEMVAVKLDGSVVERICNLRVDKYLFPSADQYYAEAHGCPSPDGLRVIFASDWNKGAYPVQAYIVDFRDKVLPLNLLSFDGTLTPGFKKEVKLRWKTTNEVNTQVFDIDKSTDGRYFSRIGSLDAKNTDGVHEYSFIDRSPFEGIAYYRLKQTDQDGAIQHSEVIAINNQSTFDLTLYPNPTKNVLNISHSRALAKASFSIISLYGKEVVIYNLPEGTLKSTIDVSELSKGVYVLTYKNGGTINSLKFVKE